jgi:hypothetical protein
MAGCGFRPLLSAVHEVRCLSRTDVTAAAIVLLLLSGCGNRMAVDVAVGHPWNWDPGRGRHSISFVERRILLSGEDGIS